MLITPKNKNPVNTLEENEFYATFCTPNNTEQGAKIEIADIKLWSFAPQARIDVAKNLMLLPYLWPCLAYKNYTVAKIRLVETAKDLSKSQAIFCHLKKGTFEIVKIITIDAEELRPVNLREYIIHPTEKELDAEMQRHLFSIIQNAIKILDAHIQRGTPNTLEIFSDQELKKILQDGGRLYAGNIKVLDYLEKEYNETYKEYQKEENDKGQKAYYRKQTGPEKKQIFRL